MENSVRLYSIRDTGAELYGPLFDAPTDVVAARSFKNVMQKVQNDFRKDYSLFFMGTMNIKTGEVITSTPSIIVDGGMI